MSKKKVIRKKTPDTYEIWERNGKLPEILEFVKECSRKLVTQGEMCRHLGITAETFVALKKKHPLLEEAQVDAKLNLKMDLVGAVYERAVGCKVEDKNEIIENGGNIKNPKKKIIRTTRTVVADPKSAIYLLTKHFGIEFSDKSEEIKMMEQRLNNQTKEEWNVADNNNEDNES